MTSALSLPGHFASFNGPMVCRSAVTVFQADNADQAGNSSEYGRQFVNLVAMPKE